MWQNDEHNHVNDYMSVHTAKIKEGQQQEGKSTNCGSSGWNIAQETDSDY